MDILYLLIPMSVVLAFGVLAVFAWALRAGQFETLEREGERILDDEDDGCTDPVGGRVDGDQGVD
ncbi:cbb3-type cytochrome oxidase assembly protein CcoS [Inhella gelatinilytica]|uniref:Cbb3-type cytochrome oxidase assembly protein CcoS n=1 Tax=Inhella gelatinilytica TaxID=2795030 RepID=A0A931IY89_9BURK|nr:cbb3-type cytochrome oxidase assembly protein CcoS [Inhella gelatinilytica]MBH9554097.1 cbb3-type cytochrome oxidase assembly protein CcoS [Inhella gelatinilytica]